MLPRILLLLLLLLLPSGRLLPLHVPVRVGLGVPWALAPSGLLLLLPWGCFLVVAMPLLLPWPLHAMLVLSLPVLMAWRLLLQHAWLLMQARVALPLIHPPRLRLNLTMPLMMLKLPLPLLPLLLLLIPGLLELHLPLGMLLPGLLGMHLPLQLLLPGLLGLHLPLSLLLPPRLLRVHLAMLLLIPGWLGYALGLGGQLIKGLPLCWHSVWLLIGHSKGTDRSRCSTFTRTSAAAQQQRLHT